MKPNLPECKVDQEVSTALVNAIELCTLPDDEEHGGMILEKDGEYEFHYLRNNNTGNPIAQVLFTANKEDVGNKIIPKLVSGWKSYGSFHVHPVGPMCSGVDCKHLFLGFSRNFIYGRVSKTIIQYKRIHVEEAMNIDDENQVIWYPHHGETVIWQLNYVLLSC